MTRGRKIVLAALVSLVGVLIAAGTVFYTQWWLPNRRMRDSAWWESAGDAERLETAHRVLAWPWGNHHDAFLVVGELGGPNSVPVLIRALRWQPDGPIAPCTKQHCLDALRHITGVDAGNDHADWKRWWDSVGHRVRPHPTTQPATGPAFGPPRTDRAARSGICYNHVSFMPGPEVE